MSERFIPKCYRVKHNGHDWSIYMGGKKRLPLYPVKVVEPKKIVKRYLIKNSSEDGSYTQKNVNIYPLSILESFINENEETMEFEGNIYYVWRGYNQYYDEQVIDEYIYLSGKQILLLTTTLDISLPLNYNSPEFAYMITIEDGDKTNYLGKNYTFVAQVDEYEDGERKVKMANIGARMYNFNDVGEYDYDVMDYFQYDGEIVEFEGQRCFVWNRYDSNRLCESEDGTTNEMPKIRILTNTLWIASLPFRMDSPEFVTWINYDTGYPNEPEDMPFDRIEYFPDTIYGDTITGMTYSEIEVKVNLNVTTVLDDGVPGTDGYSKLVYDGYIMQYEGKICYRWNMSNIGSRHNHILTDTLELKLPFNDETSPEFVAYLTYDSDGYIKKGKGWNRGNLVRYENSYHFPFIYGSETKKVLLVK